MDMATLRVCDYAGHLFVVYGHGTGLGEHETLWGAPVCVRCGAHADVSPAADAA